MGSMGVDWNGIMKTIGTDGKLKTGSFQFQDSGTHNVSAAKAKRAAVAPWKYFPPCIARHLLRGFIVRNSVRRFSIICIDDFLVIL
jgi:hypothetical protein